MCPASCPTMDLKSQLIAAAEAYCARTGMSKARLATIIANDGKFFDRLDAGGTVTLPTFERIMAYFAAHAESAEPTRPSKKGRAA